MSVRTGLGRDALGGIAGIGLEKIVALGIALYLPRHLGLADYGRYALVVSCLGVFQVLPDAGLEAILVTRLARTGDEGRALAGRGALVRLAVSLLGGVAGLTTLALASGDAALVRAGAIASGGFAVGAASPYRVFLRARLRLDAYVALVAGQAALGVALLALVVHAGGGLPAVFGAVSAAAVGGLALGRLLVGAGARLRPDAPLGRSLVADAWPLAGTSFVLLGAQQVVVQILVLRLHGAEAVGLLAAAQRLVEAVGLLPQALMLSVLPALATAGGRPVACERAREAARVLAVVVGPGAALLALAAGPILGTVLGPRVVPAASTLAVLAPAAVLGATGAVLTNLLTALGQQRFLLRAGLGSAALMVVLAGLLVPRYGAPGAAAAVGGSMLAGQLALAALAATADVVRPVLASVVRPIVLGVGAVAAATATGSAALGAAVLLVGYPAALLATRTVTRADLGRWRT